ncbi:VOC family protein [Cognatishimia sp.]|uniref:VOC family protein n=1 Tax=Cognatishimia sp. TaxID=2211648 RepID=UPI003BAC6F6C
MAHNLGIDHPLVAVRDLNAAIETYRSLGFHIAPPGQHPWGTSTALALFRNQLLELVSVGDATLLDGYETNGFLFGRHIERYLETSEGVALSALFTEDAEAEVAALSARGITCTGTVDFGRDVIRSDGQPDRTKTTLKVFRNDTLPRLSVFACQQHRRDLLEFPDRMEHPNGSHGFEAATIASEDSDSASVLEWLINLHGSDVTKDADGFTMVQTTNGFWRVMNPDRYQTFYGTELPANYLADGPRVAALDVRVSDLAVFNLAAIAPSVPLTQIGDALVANDMSKLGGISMRFVARPKQRAE